MYGWRTDYFVVRCASKYTHIVCLSVGKLRCGAEFILSLSKGALAFGNPLRGFANRRNVMRNAKAILLLADRGSPARE